MLTNSLRLVNIRSEFGDDDLLFPTYSFSFCSINLYSYLYLLMKNDRIAWSKVNISFTWFAIGDWVNEWEEGRIPRGIVFCLKRSGLLKRLSSWNWKY